MDTLKDKQELQKCGSQAHPGKSGRKLFKDIYKNKKVLVTGNTGFKGSWLSSGLKVLC